MSTLTTEGREVAQAAAGYTLAPSGADAAAVDITASVRFAIGSAGTRFVATATAPYHLLAGDSSVAATTASPAFAAGATPLVIPDGCTHVAMIRATATTTLGCAYKG